MEETIRKVFGAVWREQNDSEPPQLADDTLLLETGLDSLGFAIIVTRLEEEIGLDPFSISDEAFYPETFRQFVDHYEKHAPNAS